MHHEYDSLEILSPDHDHNKLYMLRIIQNYSLYSSQTMSDIIVYETALYDTCIRGKELLCKYHNTYIHVVTDLNHSQGLSQDQ